jgi:hypothetical protein
MSTYEIRTHRSGITYRAERKEIVQWTILVKEPADALRKILKIHQTNLVQTVL